jgi:quercetin 2,3-dioxygenase
MITIRKAENRGHFDHGWLNTYHTFSFADYYDPAHMGFRDLRVINQDRVQPGRGFPTHGHRDMEIISYVLEGALQHKDSMGNGSVIRPGEVQRMSAGTGVMHSEYNPSKTDLVHFLQIWILPEKRGLKPEYEQRMFSAQEKQGKLRLIVSRDGREGSVQIHQDVDLYAGVFDAGQQATHRLRPGGHAWLQVARGKVLLNDASLKEGDGAAVDAEALVELTGQENSDVLLFDLN